MNDLFVGASGLELGPSGRGGPQSSRSGRDLEMVGGGSEMEGSSGRMMTSGRLEVPEASGWTLGVVDFSVSGTLVIILKRVKF